MFLIAIFSIKLDWTWDFDKISDSILYIDYCLRVYVINSIFNVN